LIAGALVTSNDAGLAVPDWPLSFGSLTPPMVGGIFYEHSHRVIVPSVGQGSSRISLGCGCDTCFSLYEFENVGIDLVCIRGGSATLSSNFSFSGPPYSSSATAFIVYLQWRPSDRAPNHDDATIRYIHSYTFRCYTMLFHLLSATLE
jgi:hypothetical protein